MADKITILTAKPGLYWLPELRIFVFKPSTETRKAHFECFSAAPGGAWGKHDFDKPYEVVNPLFPDGSTLGLIPEPKAEPKAEPPAPAKPDAEAYTYADAEADDKRRWKLVTQLVGVGVATSNVADAANAVVETLAAERAKGRRKADGGERG